MKFLKIIYSPIYSLIGFITKPPFSEQCESGDWWIPSNYESLPRGVWGEEIHDYHYRYVYQKIIQNNFGKWIKASKWIGRHYTLKYYRDKYGF